MLFKDMCVVPLTVPAVVETENEITRFGYKVKVGSSYVTDLRVFNNQDATTVQVNLENLINFGRYNYSGFFISNQFAGNWKMNDADAFKTVALEEYSVVYDKETGDITETLGSVHTMADVIDGKFGNYLPNLRFGNNDSKQILLSGKYLSGKTYKLYEDSFDIITVFVREPVSLLIIKPFSVIALVTQNLTKGLHVIHLNPKAYGLTERDVVFALWGSFTDNYVIRIQLSSNMIGSVQNSGICEPEIESSDNFFKDYHLYFKHPYGGIETLGTINMMNVSGGQNRASVRLADRNYDWSGSFNIPNSPAYAYSSERNIPFNSEGFVSLDFETEITDVDPLWIAAAMGSKTAFLVRKDLRINTVIEYEINSISASREATKGGDYFWKLFINVKQAVPFVS